ncbi:hypothetical protein ABXV22_08180 [Vibrio rotiferianus]|uniref:hypothetical protein n=1 Tax=Vibrio rotiferianus TaxID=190895 RepID=UPI0005EFA44C|nr:hypothetical protein [Vibrio rotiferianus]
MFSKEGDHKVANAAGRFINSIKSEDGLPKIGLFDERLGLLQDSSIRVGDELRYDDFIGYVDEPLPFESLPEGLFEYGDYE